MYNIVHPGRIIKEQYQKPLKLTTIELAQSLGVTRQAIASVINERAGISPIMAMRLSYAFDTTPDFWMNMQKNYELKLVTSKFDAEKEVKKLYVSTLDSL